MRQCLLIFAALLAFAASPRAVSAQNVLTAVQWRADLHYLAAEIPKVHPRAFHAVTKVNFDRAVGRLDARIPGMSDSEIEVAFARLVAMLGEGHSRLSFPGLVDPMTDVPKITPFKNPRLAFRRLPVRLYSFSDGLFIVAATPQYRSLIGEEVTKIGGRPASTVLDEVAPIISHDNAMGIRLIAPQFVAVPKILQALHIIGNRTQVSLTLRAANGPERSIVLSALPLAANPAEVDAFERFGTVPPLDFQYGGRNFRFEYLKDSKTAWVGVHVIEDEANESISQFAASVGSFLDSHTVDRVVVDLRNCRGGNNQLFRPLLLELVRNKNVDRLSRLFVLMNRGTFSAAVNSAGDMQWLTNAIFAGEPTGGAPNSFGDPRKITLPNSGLIVRISTIYWRDQSPDESRSWLSPDIAVSLSSHAYFAGQDPALDAVTSFKPGVSFGDALTALAAAGDDIDSILRFYLLRKSDPEWANDSTEQAMQQLGEALVSRQSYEDAFLVFRINAGDYPGSLRTAIAAVKQAQQSHPKDSGLASLLKRLQTLGSAPAEL